MHRPRVATNEAYEEGEDMDTLQAIVFPICHYCLCVVCMFVNVNVLF